MPEAPAPSLILASGSRARREMLAAAGLTFEAVPSQVDEGEIRTRVHASQPGASAGDVAVALARAKALQVSARFPQALVIGADQVLALGSRQYQKPTGTAEARTHLLELRGREHGLWSAAAVAFASNVVWERVDCARMTMRDFSDDFLDDYMLRMGQRVADSVGCYQLEGIGLQLFDRIEGDYFTILGMPLLPLLAELRSRGVIKT